MPGREAALPGVAVQRLTALAATIDGLRPRHGLRVGVAAESLASRLGLDGRIVAHIRHAAPLHDVGKLHVPPAMLLKAGPLTIRQRIVVQRHAAAGERLCRAAGGDPILRMAAQIARSHHERWDGRGYPDGLRVDEIPLTARIVSVVDVYDALVTERPYFSAWAPDRALAYIVDHAGSRFDPEVVGALTSLTRRSARGGRCAAVRAQQV